MTTLLVMRLCRLLSVERAVLTILPYSSRKQNSNSQSSVFTETSFSLRDHFPPTLTTFFTSEFSAISGKFSQYKYSKYSCIQTKRQPLYTHFYFSWNNLRFFFPGYGSVSPKTSWGKMVTIIYALVGIPLMLLYLSTTGDLLARSFRRLYGKLCGVSNQKPQCPCTNPVRVPVTLCLIIVLAYICSGAVLFHRLENWSLLEGSYFCFTSLGTIGFGDLLPGQNAEEISLCACSAYILTGMALVAMCFSLVQDEVINLLRYIGATCTRNKMLKVRDEESAMGTSWQRPQTEGAAPIKRPPMVNKIPPMLQHNSLPRKSNFQRNTPARRSAGEETIFRVVL